MYPPSGKNKTDWILVMSLKSAGFQNGEDIKNLKFTCCSLLLLHAARYYYYMQLVTPSDAATAVTIDNKIWMIVFQVSRFIFISLVINY